MEKDRENELHNTSNIGQVFLNEEEECLTFISHDGKRKLTIPVAGSVMFASMKKRLADQKQREDDKNANSESNVSEEAKENQ